MNATTEQALEAAGSAVLGLRDGGNVLVVDPERGSGAKNEVEGGVIYTDMPALREVLAQLDVITAVIYSPPPRATAEAPASTVITGSAEEVESTTDSGFGDALVLGGLPVGVFVVGLLMLIVGVTEGSIVPNPYLGLYVMLAGVGLGITSWFALREQQSE